MRGTAEDAHEMQRYVRRPTEAGLELSCYEFLDRQRQQGAAISAQQFCFLAVAFNDSNFETIAVGAAGGWLAGCGLGELNKSLGVE